MGSKCLRRIDHAVRDREAIEGGVAAITREFFRKSKGDRGVFPVIQGHPPRHCVVIAEFGSGFRGRACKGFPKEGTTKRAPTHEFLEDWVSDLSLNDGDIFRGG